MDADKLIDELLDALAIELRANKVLREKLLHIVAQRRGDSVRREPESRSTRRKPGAFDPMLTYREAPGDLKQKLEQLDVEALKDIIAEQGMDRSKLAMKWKSKERLVDLIVSTVASRAQKGDAFRSDASPEAID